jgi:hypothetical protein
VFNYEYAEKFVLPFMVKPDTYGAQREIFTAGRNVSLAKIYFFFFFFLNGSTALVGPRLFAVFLI